MGEGWEEGRSRPGNQSPEHSWAVRGQARWRLKGQPDRLLSLVKWDRRPGPGSNWGRTGSSLHFKPGLRAPWESLFCPALSGGGPVAGTGKEAGHRKGSWAVGGQPQAPSFADNTCIEQHVLYQAPERVRWALSGQRPRTPLGQGPGDQVLVLPPLRAHLLRE